MVKLKVCTWGRLREEHPSASQKLPKIRAATQIAAVSRPADPRNGWQRPHCAALSLFQELETQYLMALHPQLRVLWLMRRSILVAAGTARLHSGAKCCLPGPAVTQMAVIWCHFESCEGFLMAERRGGKALFAQCNRA